MRRHSSTTTSPLSQKQKVLYASFWSRGLGFITDIFMIGLPITLVSMALFGYDQMHTATGLDVIAQNDQAKLNPPNPYASIMQVSLFLISYVVFWKRTGQTPGKKMAHIKVVDASTFENAPYYKLVLRFFGYFLSLITIIGFFTGLLRRDKRALHDLLSGTAVIREA